MRDMPEEHAATASLELISRSVVETVALGRRLGAWLQPGDVVLLYAPLGAGKTHLTKGIAAAWGVDEAEVSSPTFVLVNVYEADRAHGRRPIYHVDLYRIDAPEQLVALGWDDVLAGDGLTIIEWAERAEGWLPREHLAIHIAHLGPEQRQLRFCAQGARPRQVLEALRADLLRDAARAEQQDAAGD